MFAGAAIEQGAICCRKGKFCNGKSAPMNQGVACCISLLHNGLMKYGYARVSTFDQNPALQLAALKKAACREVFKDEGISGATTKRCQRGGCE